MSHQSRGSNRMRRTLQEMFCFCVRDDTSLNNDRGRSSSRNSLRSLPSNRSLPVSHNLSMQAYSSRNFEKSDFAQPEKLTSLSSNKWLTQKLSSEQQLLDSFEIIYEIEKEEEEKLENRNLSYFSQLEGAHGSFQNKMGFSEETKTSSNEHRNLRYESGLLVRCSNQFFSIKVQSLSSSSSRQSTGSKRYCNLGKQERLLLNMFYEVQVCDFNIYHKLLEKHETLLLNSMIGEDLCKYISKRAKSDSVLVAHDPTGSMVLQQLFVSQRVYYLEESKTFSQVLDKAVRKMNMEAKLIRIFKSEIVTKYDTAIINLMHHEFIDVAAIFYEYFHLAHDIILLLPGDMQNTEIIVSVTKALKMTDQYVRHASIELQQIYDGDTVVGKVVFYGEVSDVDVSEELHYLYSCISPDMKRKYKYQVLLRELRKKHSMLKIFELYDKSDENFLAFVRQISQEKLLGSQNLNKFFIKRPKQSDTSSSTESENENEAYMVAKPYKVHSRSEHVQREATESNRSVRKYNSANYTRNEPLSRFTSDAKMSMQRTNQYPD